MITTFKFQKAIQEVFEDVKKNHYLQYSPAQKQEALSVIEHTKSVTLQLLSDGDTKREIRRKLAEEHKLLVSLQTTLNQEIDQTHEREVLLTVWFIVGVCIMIYMAIFV